MNSPLTDDMFIAIQQERGKRQIAALQKIVNAKAIKNLGRHGEYEAVQDIDNPERIYVRHPKDKDQIWYRWYKAPDLTLNYGEPDYPVTHIINIVK